MNDISRDERIAYDAAELCDAYAFWMNPRRPPFVSRALMRRDHYIATATSFLDLREIIEGEPKEVDDED